MVTDSTNSPVRPGLRAPRLRFPRTLSSSRIVFLGLARWQLTVILSVAAYDFVAVTLFDVAFRHLCLGAIVIGLAVSGRTGARRFLLDWFRLLLFWIGYDAMRDFADQIIPRVAVFQPYALEMKLSAG
jgi:hypothetical protein